MKMIKKFDVLSVAKVFGILYGGIYLVAGLAVNLAVLLFGIPALQKFDLLGFGSGILATLMLALLVGFLSFVIGAVIAWLYNTAAKIVGGIVWEETVVERPIKLPRSKEKKVEPEHLFVSDKPQQEVNQIFGQTKEPAKTEQPKDTFSSNF